ncbi:MAG: tRNA (cytidine(34)-2'-O)-methyltransferase [marine bacterium B5-7]|nr:MAG: tRNA (cytidine(34)-2'-O)-methyltransferase [marine bacterium B5-7]
MFNVVLYQPEIPPNTGNIMRLCANTGCSLHLIRPLGFTLDDASLKRAGLDYRDSVGVSVHDDLDHCLGDGDWSSAFTFSAHHQIHHDAVEYPSTSWLIFGSETRGLPDTVRMRTADNHRVTIPMVTGSRSLNLSNAVAVAVFEAWRQHGFGSRT